MKNISLLTLLVVTLMCSGAASRSLQQDAAANPRVALVEDAPTEPLRRHKGHNDYHKKNDYSKKRRYDDKDDYEPYKPRPRPDPRPDPSGPFNTAGPNNAIFEGPTIPDPCNIGPSYWCRNNDNFNLCVLGDYKQVGVCGYASTAALCPQQSLATFCSNQTLAPLSFNGGINGSPTGYFGYFAFAMTWVASSCNSTTPLGGFCSAWSNATSYSAKNLVLHGLWPDYGSIYDAPGPQPPFFNGTQKSYQGWPQWCDGNGIKTSQCAVGPNNACPWANKTNINQNELERCFRVENVTECLVSDQITTLLGSQFAQIAPGYLAANGKPTSFMDHEYFKHGSCIGNYLSKNITAYYDTAVKLAWQLNAPGTPAESLISRNVGGKVALTDLEKGFKQQAVPTCKNNCDLDEVWYCMGRTASGLPNGLIKCPVGTLASNTCATKGCTNVNIPAWK